MLPGSCHCRMWPLQVLRILMVEGSCHLLQGPSGLPEECTASSAAALPVAPPSCQPSPLQCLCLSAGLSCIGHLSFEVLCVIWGNQCVCHGLVSCLWIGVLATTALVL